MTRPAILLLALLLSSCAHRSSRLPVCDGRHLRPANPHGSVLTGAATTVSPTAVSAGPSTKAPAAAAHGGCH